MEDFGKWIERFSKIRLKGGVVSLVVRVLLCAIVALAFIAWTAHLWWVSLIALFLVVGFCFPLLWRLINFADKNPQAAIFEGAEFLAHERMRLRLGTKANPNLPLDLSGQKPPLTIEDGSGSADAEK